MKERPAIGNPMNTYSQAAGGHTTGLTNKLRPSIDHIAQKILTIWLVRAMVVFSNGSHPPKDVQPTHEDNPKGCGLESTGHSGKVPNSMCMAGNTKYVTLVYEGR